MSSDPFDLEDVFYKMQVQSRITEFEEHRDYPYDYNEGHFLCLTEADQPDIGAISGVYEKKLK